jgi:hypothetical protein
VVNQLQMKKIIFLIPIILILAVVISMNLPLEYERSEDIALGNQINDNIDRYFKENKTIPKQNDWETLNKLGFEIHDIDSKPAYHLINKSDYELIFLEGFDGPYLVFNSIDKKWKMGFQTTNFEKSIENELNSKLDLSIQDFEKKVFTIGADYHFTEDCEFIFECDCCKGNLIFNSDNSFYYKDYCMSDQTVRPGQYQISSDTLILHFGEKCITKKYNYENEFDTSAVDYFMTDTLLKPLTIKYLTSSCKSNIQLTEIFVDDGEIAIETDLDYLIEINNLLKDNFIAK